MIYVAIIEDEKVYADYLRMLLMQWAKSRTDIQIFSYTNGAEIFKSKMLREFNVVFIDLNLGQEDGMIAAKKLRMRNYKNTIVFITNYESRAIEGYTVNAYRYFLKPIQLRDIHDCMNYVLNKLSDKYFEYTYYGLTSRIAYDDIVCFESMKHYIDICVINNKIPIHVKGVLKDIQDKCPTNFVRCQRSYIVNCHYISKRQGNKLILRNDKIIDISPRFSQIIAEIMKER